MGDTHGDAAALESALAAAAAFGAAWLISVGDLWWRPRAPDHDRFVTAIVASMERHRVGILLVDGNNDDAASLLGGRPTARPVPVTGGLWYAPRGSTWVWRGRRFVALGGALTFRRDGRVRGVDLFDGEAATVADAQRAASVGSADVFVSHDAPAGSPIPSRLLPGPDAEHRALIAGAVDALGPRLVVHGHYHREYDHSPASGPRVVGMGRDRGGTADVCFLDLRTLKVVRHLRVGPSA